MLLSGDRLTLKMLWITSNEPNPSDTDFFDHSALEYPILILTTFGRFPDYFLTCFYIKTIGDFDENPEISNPPNFAAIQYFFDRSKLCEF